MDYLAIFDWFKPFATGVVLPVVSVYAFAKWHWQKWIEHRLSERLEHIKEDVQARLDNAKAQQAKDLEVVRAQHQKEIEHLRHLLSSRVSKIHEKEFEVLPKAWSMLSDLHGWVALATDFGFKQYPDFERMDEDSFEGFLLESKLSDLQKNKLRRSTTRNAYYQEVMANNHLDTAYDRQRLFQNYLIENQIFMNDELRDRFGRARDALRKALTLYSIGKHSSHEMVAQSYGELSSLDLIVAEVERAIQRRLRYDEA